MSLFRAQNQALAMKWDPMSIDLDGKPIIRRITVTTSCHHFVLRTTTEVSRIFVQIFMAGYGPLQGVLRVDKPSAELFILHVDPISPLKSDPWTTENPTIEVGVDWNQVSHFLCNLNADMRQDSGIAQCPDWLCCALDTEWVVSF